MSRNVMLGWLLAAFAAAVVLLAPGGRPRADEKKAEKIKPIRALLICGGCCHDYSTQKLIISEGTAARAHIDWVVVQEGGTVTNSKIPTYEKPDWYKGFDIVVHNECFSDTTDPEWVEGILKPHREG